MKLEKRLCFKCDDKYCPRHKCKNQQLRVMIVSEDEDEEEIKAREEEEGSTMEEKEMELTLHSCPINSFNSPKTMKFIGEIKG